MKISIKQHKLQVTGTVANIGKRIEELENLRILVNAGKRDLAEHMLQIAKAERMGLDSFDREDFPLVDEVV